MLDVLQWVKKRAEGAAEPKGDPSPADGLLPDFRSTDPVIALKELSGWLEPSGGTSIADRTSRGDILARIQDAGNAHVNALLAQYWAGTESKHAARESTWKSLIQYQARLTHALGLSARALLSATYEDSALLSRTEDSTVRALHGCRTLAKVCLAHYAGIPRSVWRMAYALYADAEQIGSAASPVKAHVDPKKVTTIEHELLRLLMLQMSAPDMMPPEQIEIADRVLEELGDRLTLRPPGVTDNPFYFDTESDAPPQRGLDAAAPTGPGVRYFGPGVGFDALEKIHKQMAMARIDDIKIFGTDVAPRAQLAAVQHLLAFWRAKSPYSPPARSAATGALQIVHGYAHVWKQLSDTQHRTGELTLADENDSVPLAPQSWTLRETGGNELGAELADPGAGHAKCGEVVGVSVDGATEFLVGMVRRMHFEPGGSLHADIAILSRNSQALSLREVREKGEESVVSEAASRQFAFASVRAVILADGAEGSTPPNLLLPAQSWKAGRVYETTEDRSRTLRGLQAMRYGDDYVRATFEWLSGPA